MTIEERLNELTAYMAQQLRLSGGTFADVAAKAGRKLPRRLKKDIAVISDAETLLQNPKLTRRIDEAQLAKSERRLRMHLEKFDPKAERRGEILDTIAKIAFVIVVVVLALFFYLISVGYFE